MRTNPYIVKPIEGLKRSTRRAIAFLLSSSEMMSTDAMAVFNNLKPNRAREVRARFDHWIDGVQPRDNWFHGWPGHPKYKNCFTFKWKENRQHHRFYGFLFHPLPHSNAEFQLCVLACHATKNEWETDDAELDSINVLRLRADVLSAISEVYPDSKSGERKWVQ